MKKFFIVIILCLFIPFNCLAFDDVSINDVIVKGPSSVKEGEYFTITVNGVYAGLDSEHFDVLGIIGAGVNLDFDDSTLILTSIESDGYYNSSEVDEDDGSTTVTSIIDGTSKKKCADNKLYCSPYTVKLKFFVKNTDEDDTVIDVNGLVLVLYPVLKGSSLEFDEDDLETAVFDELKSIKLNIEHTSNDFNTPDALVSKPAPTIDKSVLEEAQKNSEADKKEELKFLKSLTVKDHKLDFKENKYTYEISLSDDVNKLDIEAIPYDSNATVKIVGADDLKTYSDIIKVRVELPGHEKMTYVINIKRESLSSRESKSIVNKLNTVAAGIGGGVLFILIIVWFACSRDKKKLKKLLNDSKNENEMF